SLDSWRAGGDDGGGHRADGSLRQLWRLPGAFVAGRWHQQLVRAPRARSLLGRGPSGGERRQVVRLLDTLRGVDRAVQTGGAVRPLCSRVDVAGTDGGGPPADAAERSPVRLSRARRGAHRSPAVRANARAPR